ncbi:uncharacterized protein LOC111893943 [Lactuca sativa]|uniref:uncharacterized protein LOC111893943 n=1 Tax=Lactuca sativa TaxID=4236 RepID=UPI000CD9B81A|nr:uncharacterized protein LOC111893943 [Lactuca sativa]
MKCFLDAYKGYHQILMSKEDKEKTAFYTDHGTFCYTKMPFGLKNAGATYQRLVDSIFAKQIGRNIEVYVDNMVIKSPDEERMLQDIEETFQTLEAVKMKLNPAKCTFGVEEGQFLGYYVTRQGVQPSPTKILLKPGTSGRLAKWAIELGEHDINYRPRTSIKGQALADFLLEIPDVGNPAKEKVWVVEEAPTEQGSWTLYTDGASSREGSGAGLILTSPKGEEVTYALRFDFHTSNNEAEYEALLAGLRLARQMGAKAVTALTDSRLAALRSQR